MVTVAVPGVRLAANMVAAGQRLQQYLKESKILLCLKKNLVH